MCRPGDLPSPEVKVEQALVRDPQRKPSRQRMFAAIKDRGVRRGSGRGSALPSVVIEGAVQFSGAFGQAGSGVHNQDRGSRTCVQKCLRSVRLCGAWRGERLYQMRHGSASTDALENLRSLGEIMKRGRWQSDSSVRRKASRSVCAPQRQPTQPLPSYRKRDWRDITGLQTSAEGPRIVLEIL